MANVIGGRGSVGSETISGYRTNTRDIAPAPPKAKPVKPGTLDPHHIGIFDHAGNMRGHVGPKATAATVSRFVGHGATLQTINGRQCWKGKKP